MVAPPDDDAVKRDTADAENEQVGVNGAEEPRRRDDALADCDRLLADAARVMRDARAVSQRLRDDTLAEVETQASRLIAEAEQARDAIIGDARRIRDEVLAEADADAERRQTETEQAHLVAVAEAEVKADELRERLLSTLVDQGPAKWQPDTTLVVEMRAAAALNLATSPSK